MILATAYGIMLPHGKIFEGHAAGVQLLPNVYTSVSVLGESLKLGFILIMRRGGCQSKVF